MQQLPSSADEVNGINRTVISRHLAEFLEKGSIPPYVYSYPTRSSYRPLHRKWSWQEIWREDEKHSLTDELNLYLHIPFCHYKCGFCNLYTVVSKDEDIYDRYVSALIVQMERYAEVIQRRTLRTVYIGGGTPTVLPRKAFERIFEALGRIYPNWRNSTYEVALEATPDSIVRDPGLVEFLVSIGITRVNMGVQSLQSAELRGAGRVHAGDKVIREAFEIVKRTRLPNLSTDLINGFAGQTNSSWEASVRELIELDPETISTYFLTIRPDAWFSTTGEYSYYRDPALYDRYEYARAAMLDAGYVQETNIRYKRQGRGGYIQKALQFRGVPYLGIGAGARTYTNTVDYLLNTDTQPTMMQVGRYMDDVFSGEQTISVGFEYNDEERIRKRLVLDLFDLDIKELAPYGWETHKGKFEPILNAAFEHALLQRVGETRVQLTPLGYRYRDILSWLFCSSRVRTADREFYEKLHNVNKRSKAGDVGTFQEGILQ